MAVVDAPLKIGAPFHRAHVAGECGEGFDVAAGHEMLAGAFQHNAAHRRVVAVGVQEIGHRGAHFMGQRVARVRPVHSQGGDAVGDVDQNMVGHGRVLSRARGLRRSIRKPARAPR